MQGLTKENYMQAYSKLIVAIVGVGVMLAARYGFDLSASAQPIADGIIAFLTAAGVFALPNKEA
jgi:hypothetical protein